MPSFPAFAQFDFFSGAGAFVSLIVVFGLMAMLGIFALMLFGLWTMRGKRSPESQGEPQIEEAVGKHASVYVAIPGSQSGAGKIQMDLQGRIMEYPAMTRGEQLPSGSKVVVVRVITPTTVEVQPVLDPERTNDV
jgi:membrane protein implicated in regulation of membrane protease activity